MTGTAYSISLMHSYSKKKPLILKVQTTEIPKEILLEKLKNPHGTVLNGCVNILFVFPRLGLLGILFPKQLMCSSIVRVLLRALFVQVSMLKPYVSNICW